MQSLSNIVHYNHVQFMRELGNHGSGRTKQDLMYQICSYVNNDLISSRHIFSLLSNWSPRIVPTDLPVSWPSFRNHWISVKISSNMPLINYRSPRDISILPKNHYSRRFHCQISFHTNVNFLLLLTDVSEARNMARAEPWDFLLICVLVVILRFHRCAK